MAFYEDKLHPSPDDGDIKAVGDVTLIILIAPKTNTYSVKIVTPDSDKPMILLFEKPILDIQPNKPLSKTYFAFGKNFKSIVFKLDFGSFSGIPFDSIKIQIDKNTYIQYLLSDEENSKVMSEFSKLK